ncbi:glycoside hydrolase family 36 protein [Xylona heveae TC161]|uniref:Glycoside hydrolase family 36 protein n=1 Tax=Xylona heveae (strain CBS 132557 / TC161) TaxID=1328760 RepID=A0A165JHM6_XYLHT|nr:glycoside hydrolase family 36 protein [Xylona heveae TC161]KZF26253.1 glycoside hydrolase family 36 protein [Xylona heveae TC161]
MFCNIICHPPLGRPTFVAPEQEKVSFNVVVEASESARHEKWELALWHSTGPGNDWQALTLEETTEAPLLAESHGQENSFHRKYFNGQIEVPSGPAGPLQFTIKFKTSPECNWKWVNDQASPAPGDGAVHRQGTRLSADISAYFQGSDHSLSISSVASEAPETSLWAVSAKVDAAKGHQPGRRVVKLGLPRDVVRWFALIQDWSPWLAPRQGKAKYSADKDGILCSFLRKDGLHLVVLGISGVDHHLVLLRPDEDGNVLISARNDGAENGTARVAVAVGRSFDKAMAAAMYHARRVVGVPVVSAGPTTPAEPLAVDNGVKPEWFQEWFDGLTYCTWNGLGQNLTEDKILNVLEGLDKDNIKVTNLIIDDNWQTLDKPDQSQFLRGWSDFDANKEGFPGGLKGCVSQIRQKYKNILHVAVWHALLGYWGAVAPEGQIARRYKTCDVPMTRRDDHVTLRVVDAEDVHKLYNDFYSFLSNAGIDSVKTDVQYAINDMDNADDRSRLLKAYQDAWYINILRYFSARAISCMSQTPEIMFRSQLSGNRPYVILRNTDDFFPEVPESHPWHLFCNAHNALFTQYLNVLPDWDMFQTAHPWGAYHAAGRCVSGGPVYITDVPGKHDTKLIRQMTAQTPRGSTVILRPHLAGKTIEPYSLYQEEHLLRVSNYVGMQGTGTGILGVFNVTQHPLTELLSLGDFPGTEKGLYIVRSHCTGVVSKPLSRDDKTPLVTVSLPRGGWDIFSACPLQPVKVRTKDRKGVKTTAITNFGLLGKMTGSAAIIRSDMNFEENGRLRVWTSLKGLGTLGFYVSGLSGFSIRDDFMVLILGRAIPAHTVKADVTTNVLEIDVEKAWTEMGLSSGWSNEVGVEMFIR